MAATMNAVQGSANGDAGQQQPTVPAAAPLSNSSLYVGDLDREVSEAQLFELFSQVGPVASIRVCRDAVTRRSLGYAYVNYNSAVDPMAAERALETLNYTPVNEKPMRIMWSHRDPSFRKSGVGNIFIKNLDKDIDNKALHDTFSAFGNILSCKVAYDGNGESKGYGFVHFEKEESASSAIEKVNGMLLEGKKVYVGPFLKRETRPADEAQRFTNIYVKNLADTIDDKKLMDLFVPYGTVSSAVVMTDEFGKSRGFGFVNFEIAEEAMHAVDDLNGKDIEGKEIYAGRAQKKNEREAMLKQKFDEVRQERIQKFQGMNLYIKNLVDEVDDEKLRSEFAPFGTITSAKVMKDNVGKSKGFGFVCYTSPEEATRAVTEMNGKMVMGKPMYVALAQRKEVRKVQLEQQYQQRMPVPSRPGAPAGPLPGMFPPGGAPAMFYPGPGMPAQRGPGGPGMMYPPMMQRGMPMKGARGRGPMLQQQMMMAGPGRPGPRGYGPGPRGRGPREPYAPRGGRIPQAPARRGPVPVQQPPPPQQPPAPPAPVPTPAQSGVVPGHEGMALTTAMLANASPEQQKQMLGERLFPLVTLQQPELAGKITGMLLEMDNSELLLLLESPEALEAKVQEAIEVLRQHNAIPDESMIRQKEPAVAAA